MTTYVNLQHERTGEIKSVKVGWSWTLFLFSQFWGVPLFLRHLFDWGMINFILSLLFYYSMSLAEADPNELLLALAIGIAAIGVSIYLGLRGNELTAKQLLRAGWIFANPDDVTAQQARREWTLP